MTRTFRGWAGSADALCDDGAIIACRLWPSRAVQDAMYLRGEITKPHVVHLMVDTGAAVSGVVGSVAGALGLAPRRKIPIVSVTQQVVLAQVYPAVVELGLEHADGPQAIRFPLDVVGLPESVSGAQHGVLGRSFLRAFDLAYAGPDGRFALVLR